MTTRTPSRRPPRVASGSVEAAEISTSRLRVLERAFSLLDRFEDGEPHGVSELARAIGMHPATVHRMLAVMAERGWLRQDAESRYVLGPRLVQLGASAAMSMNLSWAAQPELTKLVAACGETAHVMIQDDTEGLYLDRVESPRAFRMPSQVGRRIPLHATAVGKALLAFLPADEVERIARASGLPRFTDRTIQTMVDLRRALVRVTELGYAVDDEELEIGLRCIGAPLFDAVGRVVASISIAGPASRVAPARDAEFGELVRSTALEISKRLGYRLEMHAAERPFHRAVPAPDPAG